VQDMEQNIFDERDAVSGWQMSECETDDRK
jgi:hypothetical protein